ncbi:ABC transporter permease [Haliangium sp.]|uniref:ABC transporter permease n=1 Tax=Haliangium sp. TaxID=2663208 RepID=UPI003D109FDC
MSANTPDTSAGAAPATPGPAGTGAIYDLGYERYQGERRVRGARAGIIARAVVRQAWKSRWGVKLPLILAVVVTVGAAVMMWVLRHDVVEMARGVAAERGARLPVPRAEAAMHSAVGGYAFLAFLLGTVVGCRQIADDLRLGSFQFYFARPLGAADYVAGKLLGVAFVVGLPMLAGPLILSLVRLLIAHDAADAFAHADVVARALAVGLIGTVSYTVVGLAAGALARRRSLAQAGFAVYYLVVANMIELAARQTGRSWLALGSIEANLTSVGAALFDAPAPGRAVLPHPALAAVATAALVGVGFALVVWRVRRAETSVLGGRT